MNTLKPILFPGKIHLILNDQDLRFHFQKLISEKILGFDTETRPSYKKGEVYQVALLQLATETESFLVRLHKISDFSPIREIFESKQIAKVGVAIHDDLKALQKRFKFISENFIELQTLAKDKGLKNFGLKGMTEEVLHANLSKGPKLTNWEAETLSDVQLGYAATDAWIGLRIYKSLVPE